MRVLLDTHTVLWALSGDDRLSKTALELIESLENDVLVSAVSAWEIAVKVALGKLEAPNELEAAIASAGFSPRTIGFPECVVLRSLPNHHRDPFDRMLVAQAMVDGVPIVTRDPLIARYSVPTIW